MAIISGSIALATIIAKVTGLKISALTGVRLAQNGGDLNVAREALQRDLAATTQFAADTASLTRALAELQLNLRPSLQSMCAHAQRLKTALSYLPAETRAGLNKTMQLDAKVEGLLATGLAKAGERLLHPADPLKIPLRVLRSYYFGLFLIGRSGRPLELAEQEVAIKLLRTQHTRRNTPRDQVTIASLEGRHSEPAILVERLGLLEEVQSLTNDWPSDHARYIAFALSGDDSLVSDMNSAPLIEELTTVTHAASQ